MSKYTTEVRYICEVEAGLNESGGYKSVDDILTIASPRIFSFNYPIFDETYKPILEKKILKHYYTREIGEETYGLWKLRLDTKMNEIMPYYNKLYESELLEINPLYTKNLTRTHNTDFSSSRTTGDETNSTVNNAGSVVEAKNLTDTNTKNLTNTNTKNLSDTTTKNLTTTDTKNLSNTDLYSDTPQGSLTNVDNQTYLTNARKVNNTGTDTVKETGTDTLAMTGTDTLAMTGTDTTEHEGRTTTTNDSENTTHTISSGDDSFNSTEDYVEKVFGYEGHDVSDLLIKWRETFLNIDMMIIKDLEPLFFQLW